MMRLTLIIPIYNGEQYIASTIAELEAFHKEIPFYEIIFVNDGSTDNFAQHTTNIDNKTSLPINIISYKENKGKGSAIKLAIEKAKDTDIIGFTDVELPYGLEKIKEALEIFQSVNTTDIIIGKRTQTKKDYTLYRLIYTKLFRLLLPKTIRQFTDTQCGFKFFRCKTAKDLFSLLQTSNWVFDIELLLAAKAQNKIITELPVKIKPQCKTRGSISIFSHGFQIIRDMHLIKSNEKQNRYNTRKA